MTVYSICSYAIMSQISFSFSLSLFRRKIRLWEYHALCALQHTHTGIAFGYINFLVRWLYFTKFGTNITSCQPFHGPGVDSAPSENEYQEHFLGVKVDDAWGWRLHHLHVPNVMKSGNLNLLEPSGPRWSCYGTPLPSTFITSCQDNSPPHISIWVREVASPQWQCHIHLGPDTWWQLGLNAHLLKM